jgi:hypothetical protein
MIKLPTDLSGQEVLRVGTLRTILREAGIPVEQLAALR